MSEEITKYGFNVISKQHDGVNYITIEDVDGVSNLMGCINLRKIQCDENIINDFNLETFFDSNVSDMKFTIEVAYREDKQKIYKRINNIVAGLILAAGDTKWILTRNEDVEKSKQKENPDKTFDVFSLKNKNWSKMIGIVLTSDRETRKYEKYEIYAVNTEARCAKIHDELENEEIEEKKNELKDLANDVVIIKDYFSEGQK